MCIIYVCRDWESHRLFDVSIFMLIVSFENLNKPLVLIIRFFEDF